jgi:hypothetical protein
LICEDDKVVLPAVERLGRLLSRPNVQGRVLNTRPEELEEVDVDEAVRRVVKEDPAVALKGFERRMSWSSLTPTSDPLIVRLKLGG